MPKLVLIILLTFIADSKDKPVDKDVTKRNASILYSLPAIAFESGQPVFTPEVKVTLFRKSNIDGVRVVVNDSLDIELASEVIELGSLIDFTQGTYTVVVEAEEQSETFGFTVR